MKEQPKHIKFHNRNNSKSQFDLVRLEELWQRENLNHSPETSHRVEFFILILIEKGSGSHVIDFLNYKCKKGTLLTVRKDQVHNFLKEGDLKGTLLLFTNEFLVTYLEDMEARKTMLLFNEQLGVPKIQLSDTYYKSIKGSIDRIEHEYFKVNDTHSLGIIRSELHILITQLFRIKANKEALNVDKKYLKEFIEFQKLVEENSKHMFKVLDYANEMNISTKTLNTISKTIVHKSAKAFIDEIRIKQIKRQLINTKLSIKEVAYDSGFEESSNFYKYFKRQTQLTPEQFRGLN